MKKPSIIVQQFPLHDKEERSYTVFSMSSLLNSFNGTVEVRCNRRYSFSESKETFEWNISTGGTSYSPQEAALLHAGMGLALQLAAGDESCVSTKAEAEAFHKAVQARKDMEKAQREMDAEVAKNEKQKELQAELADLKHKSGGKNFLAEAYGHSQFCVRDLSKVLENRSASFYPKYKGRTKLTKTFPSLKTAQKFADELNATKA